MSAAAVFLDRDDTLMPSRSLPRPAPPAAVGDVVDPALVRLLPGALDGCVRLAMAGFKLIVVSNQSVVARGGATLEMVASVNARVRELLRDPATGGALIDAVYICPFHPNGTVPEFTGEHPWRKPRPGMIVAAAAEHDIDLSRSWLIGDMERDVAAGIAGGLAAERCLLLGRDAGSIAEAAERILR
ncbi:MAG: D-glycero-alpha-D-manno-heptose-1,7-bisphosphate 7-phosphatase [Phycisphaerales bacterium]